MGKRKSQKNKCSEAKTSSKDPILNKNAPVTNTDNDKNLTNPQDKIKMKPPDIGFVYDSRLSSLLQEGKNRNLKFLEKLGGASKVRIFCETSADYWGFRDLLKDFNVAFFTHKFPGECSSKFSVKGLPNSIPPLLIKSEIQNAGFSVISVTQMTTTHIVPAELPKGISLVEKRPVPIFQVTLEKNQDVRKFLKLHSILSFRVKISTFKQPEYVPQCHRCQGIAHTRNYCFLPPKCVKCAGDHLSKKCSKPPEQEPKCANCGGSHTANFQDCPFLLCVKKAMKKC